MRAMLTMEHGDRSTLKLDENYPKPIAKPNELLIKIDATAVNFHDVFTRRGMPGIKIQMPVVVGSDIAGVVEATGSDVSQEWIGKAVLVDPVFRDGKRFGMIGETCDGGRAEYIAVDVGQVVSIPEGVSTEQAAALPLAYGTAWRMMVTQGKVAAGETVLVLGASGGVGAACVQISKMLGAKVIACASSQVKLDKLATLGADHLVNYTDRPFKEAVHEIVGKPRVVGTGGVDVAVNFTGGDTMKDTQKCVKLGGRILTCGATAGFDVNIDMRYLWTFEHQMIGSDGWVRQDLVDLMKAIADNKLDPFIDKIFALEETAEAERMLEDREVVGKVLIKL